MNLACDSSGEILALIPTQSRASPPIGEIAKLLGP